MKITLIQMEPKISGFNRGDFTCLNGLKSPALASLGALFQAEGHEVTIIQQGGLTDVEMLHKIIKARPDLVGFSSMSYDYPATCAVIKNLPHSISVMIGGPHITIVPDQLPKRKNCFGVIGEGERAALNLLRGNSDMRGVCNWQNGEIQINPRHPRIESLDSLPFGIPSADIITKPFVGKLMLPTVRNQVNTEVTVAQRGCTFNCKFCSSPRIWGSAVIARSVENVASEFALWQKRGVNCAFLSDLTTNVKPEYLKSLFRALIAAENKIKFYAMFRLADMQGQAMFDEELISLAARAGVIKIGVGLESFSLITQKRYHKIYDLALAKLFFQLCDRYGILTKGFCIISPEDDEESIKTSLDILRILSPDEIRISFEIDFSPSALSKAFHGGYLHRLHTDEPVRPGKLKPEQQLTARNWLRKSYYESPIYRNHVIVKHVLFPQLRPAYLEYFEHLEVLGVKIGIF